MENAEFAQKNRPDDGDKAVPLCFGDLIMLSCTIENQGDAYLCEEGCVIKKDSHVEMVASSRDLTFEVCCACDTRALVEINRILCKYGIPLSEKLSSQTSMCFNHLDRVLFDRLLKNREAEENSNIAYTQQMKGRPVSFGDLIQLKHTKRNGFLGIDLSQAPKLEPLTKRSFLTLDPSASVKFKILPRFRYLSEGNTVCYEDCITLCSAEHSSEYLHASLGFTTEKIGIVYEVNFSRDPSTTWKLERFVRYNAFSESAVKVGDVVRLYHPILNGYIAALSKKTENDDDILGFERSEDPTSQMSSTMWVIEIESSTVDGLIRSMRTFHLMHLVTKKYLSVSAEFIYPLSSTGLDVSSSGDKNNKEFLFRSIVLEKSIRQASSILLHSPEELNANSYVCWGGQYYMVDSKTNRFLHITKNEQFGGLGQEQTSATMDRNVIVLSPALFRDDFFEIQRVPDDQVQAVGTLSRMIPILRGYRDSLSNLYEQRSRDTENKGDFEFPSDFVVEVIEQLDALHSFVYKASADALIMNTLNEDSTEVPIPYCQNFMRDLRVADLLFDLLRHICKLLKIQRLHEFHAPPEWADGRSSYRSATNSNVSDLVRLQNALELPKNRSTLLICEMVYMVLLHMVRKHKQNATYVARYLDEIQEHITLNIGAETLLEEILFENELLLCPDKGMVSSSPLNKSQIRFHIQSLIRGRRDARCMPRHLAFLSSMVAVGDRGIEEHQDLVLPELMKSPYSILLESRVENQVVQLKIRQNRDDREGDWMDLGIIASGAGRQGERGEFFKEILAYWQESLLLLATLCKPDKAGRRDFLIRKVQSLVSFQICLRCLQDESLPNRLRWTACELLRVAFVEQDDFIKTSRSAGVAIWNDLDHLVDCFENPEVRASGNSNDAPSLTSPRSHEFSCEQLAEIKKTAIEFFEKNVVHYYPPRLDHANRLKISLLRLCRQLLVFGHFEFNELDSLMRISANILDFSNLRIEDADQKELEKVAAGAGEQSSKPTPARSDLDLGEGGDERHDAADESELTEQTISCALRRLRFLVGELPPLEVARLRCAFVSRTFKAKETVVKQGDIVDGMYVIQSGNAFIAKSIEGSGSETVQGTLGPSQIFGAEELRASKATWPWQVVCSTKLTALCVSKKRLHAILGQLLKNGPTSVTEGLRIVFKMQQESCLIINDIYDLRLQIRCRMLLQEYRFDVNISNLQYHAGQLCTSNSGMDLTDFPPQPEQTDDSEKHFAVRYVSDVFDSYIFPGQRCFWGLLGIKEAAILMAAIQFLISGLIFAMIAARLVSGNSSIRHPGPSSLGAAVFNLIITGVWGIFNILEILSIYMGFDLGIRVMACVQVLYTIYFFANTLASLVQGTSSGDSREHSISQAVWLGLLVPGGVYSSLVLGRLAFGVDARRLLTNEPALRLPAAAPEKKQLLQAPGATASASHKFSRALGFFDFDHGGAFSRTLTDLFVSGFPELVLDAYRLLVRTHNPVHELHRELSTVLLLTDDDSKKLHQDARGLIGNLLHAANAMQALSTDKSCQDRAELAQRLLQRILCMIDEDAPKIQRRLFQKLGLHQVVIRLLSCLPPEHVAIEGSLCYSILAGLCDENDQIKQDAAGHMHVYLKHIEVLPKLVTMFFTSLFVDNADLCETVEEGLIETIAGRIQSDPDECYFVLFRVMVLPRENGPPIRRLQNLVMKCVCGDRLLFRHLRDMLKGSCPHGGAQQARAGNLLYAALLELLAVCMAESNIDAKVRCRGAIPYLDLSLAAVRLQLRDQAVPDRAKRALLRFLEEAYVRVEFGARHHLQDAELFGVFDDFSRRIRTHPAGAVGAAPLAGAYLGVLRTFLHATSPAEFQDPDGPPARMAVHLLEYFAEAPARGAPDAADASAGRGPQGESRRRQIVQLLVERLEPHNHPRFALLKKSGQGLLPPGGEGDPAARRGPRQGGAEEGPRRQGAALDIRGGVGVLADEFLQLCGGREGGGPAPDGMLDSLRQARPGGPGRVSAGGAGDDPPGPPAPISSMCMDSLVLLLERAVTAPNFLPARLCMTGLRILLRIVQTVELAPPGGAAAPAAPAAGPAAADRRWLEEGVPRLIVRCVSAPGAPDAAVAECLAIGIELLERGKRRFQDAFHACLQKAAGAAFFGALRERLMRAERGLAAFQSLFWSKAEDLAADCRARGRQLTIAGVRRACALDKTSRSFVGSHPREVLRLLQLFCEGHNRQMQDFIRNQGRNSADLVLYAADFLVSASRLMQPMGVGLVLQGLDTLIEFVQNPCPENQRTLVDSQLPNVLNQLLQAGADAADRAVAFADAARHREETDEVKTKTVTLLLSLLERVDGAFIPSRILEALEVDSIVRQVNELHKGYAPLCDGQEAGGVASQELSENGPFRVACSLFTLLMILRHYDAEDRHQLSAKCRSPSIADAARLRANCGFVEIYRAGRLERIFFQIPAICRFLTPEAKQSIILSSAVMSNHQDKMLFFVRQVRERYEEMVHLEGLARSVLYRGYTSLSWQLEKCFFFNALLLNVLFIGGYRYADDSWNTLKSMESIQLPDEWFRAILVLAMLQLAMTSARLAGYYYDRGVLEVRRKFNTERHQRVYAEFYGGPRYYFLFCRFLLQDRNFVVLSSFLLSNVLALALCRLSPLSFLLLG